MAGPTLRLSAVTGRPARLRLEELALCGVAAVAAIRYQRMLLLFGIVTAPVMRAASTFALPGPLRVD